MSGKTPHPAPGGAGSACAASPLARRHLLAGGMAAAAATASAAALGPAPAGAQGAAPTQPDAHVFLTSAEAETLTAIVDRLVPKDATGPGAVEIGVVTFIDRQLAGRFGAAANWYMLGPFREGLPGQGWQLALTPALAYRRGLAALDRWCAATRGAAFARLTPEDQDTSLRELEANRVELDGVPGALFFELVRANTLEGYFADPVYGGNRGMAAWRMIGFPGANPVLTPALDAPPGEAYAVDPVSIG